MEDLLKVVVTYGLPLISTGVVLVGVPYQRRKSRAEEKASDLDFTERLRRVAREETAAAIARVETCEETIATWAAYVLVLWQAWPPPPAPSPPAPPAELGWHPPAR